MASRVILAIGFVAFLCVHSPPGAGANAGAVCTQKKAKATGKKASDILKAFGKNFKKPNQTKLDADISKAQSKFTKGFTKAESGTCQTSGDVGTIATQVELLVADVVAAIEPGRFVDNGDGTITDYQTGLMWEKKDDNNAGGIHDMDNYYTWSTGSPWNPDGTAFTVFLETLNNTCDGDESTPCTTDGDCTGIGNGLCGHAGYRDWRLPSEDGCNSCYTLNKCPCEPAELESILLAPYPCGTSPCVDPVFNTGCTAGCTVTTCSCTGSSGYWSSTTFAGFPSDAWYVYFFSGAANGIIKNFYHYVRAVRGLAPD
jgi:hypothetical protein